MCESRSKELEDTTLVFRCIELVISSPHTTLGEIASCATQVVSEKASSVGFLWLAQLTLNLGQDPLSQQMVSLLGLGPY